MENNIDNPPGLSPEVHIYEHQLAGHKYGARSLGMLKHKNGNFCKPLIEGKERELHFYEQIFESESDPVKVQLKSLVPEFRGTCTFQLNTNYKDVKCLCLEDLTNKFVKPSILDIKIGAITYDPEATPEKIAYELSKNNKSLILGFRILGMKIYQNTTNEFSLYDKKYGKTLSVEEIPNALKLYTSDHTAFTVCSILCSFLHKLHDIENWFSIQRLYTFYASSVLFTYEGKNSIWQAWKEKNFGEELDFLRSADKNWSSLQNQSFSTKELCNICGINKDMCNIVQSSCNLFSVHMIDFAHVFHSTEEDSNYMFGLKNIITHFNKLCQSQVTQLKIVN